MCLLYLTASILLPWISYKMLRWSGLWPYPDDEKRKPDFLDRAAESLGTPIANLWRGYISHRAKKWEYTDFNLNYWQSGQFLIKRTFTARTLLNFKVEYELSLVASRLDPEEFKKHQMLTEQSRERLAEHANEKSFLPYLEREGYFFSINLPRSIEPGKIHEAFSPTLYQFVEREGETFFRQYASGSFKGALYQVTYTEMGCEVRLGCDLPATFSDALIEENFAMLTN